MSLFKPSAETGKDARSKILLWGPPGAGKTHTALTWTKPALLDLENRARSFAQRTDTFSFAHAEIGSLKELADAFKELRSGAIVCETIVVDSASAIYFKLVSEHTRRTEQGAFVTDWVTVNRRFLDCLNFVFEISGKNVLFTAHAATKLVREGRDFKSAGLKFVGDERFRFGFDYIFRIEPKGDPTKTPAVFHVEKTSSPGIKVGSAIEGLDYAKFQQLTNCTAAKAAVTTIAPPAAVLQDDGSPISEEQVDKIEVLERRLNLGTMKLADYVKKITGASPLYQNMTSAQAARLIAALEQRSKGVA